MRVNRPIEFLGSEAERIANRATHEYVSFNDADYNCLRCDCKPWHVAADYPCGVEPPRETVEINVR